MLVPNFKRILVCCLLMQAMILPIHAQWAKVAEWLVDVGANVERNSILKQLADAKFDSLRFQGLRDEARRGGVIMGNKDENVYLTLEKALKENTNSCLNQTQRVRLTNLGNKIIGKVTSQYIDQLIAEGEFHSLEHALGKELIMNKNGTEDIEKTLLADINADKNLAALFRRHPAALTVYLNSISVKERTDKKHLLYWSVLANGYGTWFPKEKLVDGKGCTFEKSTSGMNIAYHGTVLGCETKDGLIECYTADLLNLAPFPKKVYQIKNAKYMIDGIGRVVRVDVEISQSHKGKTKMKSTLKEKKILQAKRQSGDDMAFYLVPREYGGITCSMNVVPILKKNKKTIKAYLGKLKKSLKEKEIVKLTTQLSYIGVSEKLKMVKVHMVDGEDWEFINATNEEMDSLSVVVNNEKKRELDRMSKILSTEGEVKPKVLPEVSPGESDSIEIDSNEIYENVDQMPEFPGGRSYCLQFLDKNINYPTIAQENGTQGRVIVEIVINKDGTISDSKIVRGVDPYLNKEALRVVMTMPKWKPGRHKGKVVRAKFTLPVMFRLQ